MFSGKPHILDAMFHIRIVNMWSVNREQYDHIYMVIFVFINTANLVIAQQRDLMLFL